VFRVTFWIEPAVDGVQVEPAQFETTLHREADPSRGDGWMFFRDNLWCGELGAPQYFRELTEDALGVPVTSVSFSELQTDRAYLDALRAEIETYPEEFAAETADNARSKYLGSSQYTGDSQGAVPAESGDCEGNSRDRFDRRLATVGTVFVVFGQGFLAGGTDVLRRVAIGERPFRLFEFPADIAEQSHSRR